MKKLWRLLMASTVLSGLAGLGMAHAATDVALPRTNDAGHAPIILAQAVSPEDAARTKQQQQRRDERQKERQNTQKPDTRKPATASPPPPPATRASPPPPPATRASPPPPPAARDARPERQDRQQDRDRTTKPASPPPPPPTGAKPASPPTPPAAATTSPPQPPAAATTAPREDRGQNQNQGRDRDPKGGQTTKPSAGTTPGAQDGATIDRRAAPLTRSGNPAPAADAKPIEPAGKGRGVAVRSGGKEIRSVNELKSERRETKEGTRTVIREPDRTIIKDGNRTIIRHDETNRFRVGARDVRVERRGNDNVTIIMRPGGERIVTVVDSNGFLLRRSRFLPNGQEIIIIDNRPRAGMRVGNFFVMLPPPRIRIPRDRYIVAYRGAPPALIYATLMAPPVDVIERPYSLDEIRYSAPVRDRMPRIDLDDITFDTGSWELAPEQIDKLAPIADGMKRAIEANPQAVFLIEGHTDAVGDENDNLSLSDRRAESVAVALTEQFEVPPENLSTQGYGEQHLKVPTDGPEEANRRVTVRNIAPLLAGRNEQAPR